MNQFEVTPPYTPGVSTPYLLQRWVPETKTWSVFNGIWADDDAEAVRIAQLFLDADSVRSDWTWQVTRVLAAAGPEIYVGQEADS